MFVIVLQNGVPLSGQEVVPAVAPLATITRAGQRISADEDKDWERAKVRLKAWFEHGEVKVGRESTRTRARVVGKGRARGEGGPACEVQGLRSTSRNQGLGTYHCS